jgi:hypothetical protein
MHMSRRRKIAILLISILILMWICSFLFPQLTIRRYMAARLHLISAFTSSITSMERYDEKYGHLYEVKGYVDWSTGQKLGAVYLEKVGPFWIVSSAGGAP